MLLVYIQSKSAVTSFKIRAVLSNTADYLEKLCSVTLSRWGTLIRINDNATQTIYRLEPFIRVFGAGVCSFVFIVFQLCLNLPLLSWVCCLSLITDCIWGIIQGLSLRYIRISFTGIVSSRMKFRVLGESYNFAVDITDKHFIPAFLV